VMVAFNLVSGVSKWEQGFSPRANWKALWLMPPAIIIAAAMLATAAWAGTLHPLLGYRTPALHAFGYVSWAFLQEWMALGFVLVRLERMLSPRYAVLACAVIFSVAHIPNPMLMASTFAMAATFAFLFRRYRALFPMAFAHALLGLTLALALPGHLTHFMRVGAGYFR
jgi:membrane protease YdiL (CAAX protease family)